MTASVFQHEFANVEEYLHHRDPYLMVRNIEAIDRRSIETSTLVTGDEFFMGGHFPGAPIVPGAMLQEMTTQTAGILIAARFNPMEKFNTHDPFFNEYALGVLTRVRAARFRGFARPGDTLHISVELVDQLGELFEFKGRITLDEKLVMSNNFQLANIPSTTLQGKSVASAAVRSHETRDPSQTHLPMMSESRLIEIKNPT